MQNITSSSSSESDTGMELMDESSEGHQLNVMEGDNVIVKYAGKSQIVHNIAHVDVIDGDDVEGTFLSRVFGRARIGHTTFILNSEDEASFPRDDIVKKLSTPTRVGGTSRRSNQSKFPCNLDQTYFVGTGKSILRIVSALAVVCATGRFTLCLLGALSVSASYQLTLAVLATIARWKEKIILTC